jgi:hypothetical protein
MKDWKRMAETAGLEIPDVERLAPSLDALEAVFRPLVEAIPHDAEPPLVFLPEALQ